MSQTRCRPAKKKGGKLFIMKTTPGADGKVLTTFIAAATAAEAEREADRRLRQLHTGGESLWYDLTDEQIAKALQDLHRSGLLPDMAPHRFMDLKKEEEGQ
jgi:hypothetical protein